MRRSGFFEAFTGQGLHDFPLRRGEMGKRPQRAIAKSPNEQKDDQKSDAVRHGAILPCSAPFAQPPESPNSLGLKETD